MTDYVERLRNTRLADGGRYRMLAVYTAVEMADMPHNLAVFVLVYMDGYPFPARSTMGRIARIRGPNSLTLPPHSSTPAVPDT